MLWGSWIDNNQESITTRLVRTASLNIYQIFIALSKILIKQEKERLDWNMNPIWFIPISIREIGIVIKKK